MSPRPSRISNRQSRKAPITREQAKRYALKNPENADAWQRVGRLCAGDGDLGEAQHAFEKAVELASEEPSHYEWLGYVAYKRHEAHQALKYLDKAESVGNVSVHGLVTRAKVYIDAAAFDKALIPAEQAERQGSNEVQVLDTLGAVYNGLHKYEEAKVIFDRLIKIQPSNSVHWNNAGNVRRDLGQLQEAYTFFQRAAELSGKSPVGYSNQLTAMHYDPDASREAIAELAQAWEMRYLPSEVLPRPQTLRQADKRLRIGLFSDGFRKHPVGKMIIRCLENLAPHEAELFAYTSSEVNDELTRRIKAAVHHWVPMRHLSDEGFAQRIRYDELDILIDLSGHNAGTRMRVMAMQPAPLLVKWVGGLINTTGVKAIDYLISDHIETPAEEDVYFTENLIRMPDDYIVFDPPSKLPNVAELPAKRNGYITLACFNNPTKLNSVTLAEWAKIMHQLPNSKLLLKGRPYTSEEFCERLYSMLEAEGIERNRLLIEGPGSNYELLEAYNQADIALDPWPYSGGLTTCEAFLMGVPVVTLPGPTFAGRHSASHLVHAGMPELVTHSWEEYHERVLELASDLDSLGTIRQHLRDVLLQSPVCDGPRFANHFTKAMRAIWQRYCEEKSPAALAFTRDGQPQFEGEPAPVVLQTPPPLPAKESSFNWTFAGKVVAMDNGARFLKQAAVQQLLKLKSLEVIAFDPAGELNTDPVTKLEGIHYYAGALLGSGEPTTLYACLDSAQSATLPPIDSEWLPATLRNANKVLAKLPVNSLVLDSIDGLPALDWLVLDARHNAGAILESGSQTLKNTLLLDISVAFQPTHEHQPNLAELQHWASRNGFRFYRLNTPRHHSHLPENVPAAQRQATELHVADALFLPSYERMAELTDNQRIKLAFLLHSVYGIKDMSYKLLTEVDQVKAESYLTMENFIPLPSAPAKETSPDKPEAETFPLPDAPFMSEAERQLFKKSLQQASQYFEFGSGGSTVWAVGEGLVVKGVESDAKWVNALKAKLGNKCRVDAVDIGPTKEWGFPVSMQEPEKFPAYSEAINQHKQEFDLILVDGRFRVACTMAAIQHILEHSKNPQKARIFIHDFWNRSHYHVVLPFLEAVEEVESAGLFKVAQSVSKYDVAALWGQYKMQPQ